MRYQVDFLDQTFSTTNSMTAARVFVQRLRQGYDPTGWAIRPMATSVSMRRVTDWSPNVKKMQQRFVIAGIVLSYMQKGT